VVFDGHRRGDWTPWIFRTENFGDDWTALGTDGLTGFVHTIEEDPVSSRLLFAGTEFGLFVSLDGGDHWMPWRNGIPAVPVRAIMVHPRDHDLVMGTHGRAAFVLDDIRPLRELSVTPALADSPLHLFTPPPAYQVEIAERIGYRSTGHAMFFGENRAPGALVSLWVGPELGAASVQVEILDSEGSRVRSFREDVREGLNRFTWDLRMDSPAAEGGGYAPPGPLVLPGEYGVRVSSGENRSEVVLDVLPDPRVQVSLRDRQAKLEALEEAGQWMGLGSQAQDRVEETLARVRQVLENLPADGGETLRASGVELEQALETLIQRLFTGPECQGICGGNPLAAPIREAMFRLSSSPEAPSATDLLAMDQARSALQIVLDEVNTIMGGDVATFRNRLVEAGYTPFSVPEPLEIRHPR
jgi:hypothetical protein